MSGQASPVLNSSRDWLTSSRPQLPSHRVQLTFDPTLYIHRNKRKQLSTVISRALCIYSRSINLSDPLASAKPSVITPNDSIELNFQIDAIPHLSPLALNHAKYSGFAHDHGDNGDIIGFPAVDADDSQDVHAFNPSLCPFYKLSDQLGVSQEFMLSQAYVFRFAEPNITLSTATEVSYHATLLLVGPQKSLEIQMGRERTTAPSALTDDPADVLPEMDADFAEGLSELTPLPWISPPFLSVGVDMSLSPREWPRNTPQALSNLRAAAYNLYPDAVYMQHTFATDIYQNPPSAMDRDAAD
ncbi:hypothetical protein S7711_10485 [Stachybotrys chartarum IBT 7711]|uniref:Uncharacterized protein n=1 Tax=Stachybotrys chartarum (strain CBS 109288 / IBT 7711) TaxID=1280523 RepID=A0A084BC73_STACB|nr:hypothetical protein S7711_10485 [Stachybotrys chartarum IBT 7711]